MGRGAAGLAIGWQTTNWHRTCIKPISGDVMLAGSTVPLLRNLSIFLAKYVLNVAYVLLPAAYSNIALLDIAVSGLSAGYFAAWMLRFVAWYRGSPRVAAPVTVASR